MAQLPNNAGSLVGKRLDEYEILALLALGGTAEIYLARHGGVAGFEKYVVVKCLHDHLTGDGDFTRMFLDEARLGAQLSHSNIVQTIKLGSQNDRYYMVMEYLTGLSLSMIIRRGAERLPQGRLPADIGLNIVAQACAGMHYAHTLSDSDGNPLNVVHRDVSPQNLVITFEGVVKIVDFGIAKAAVRETQTQSGTIKGKFAYMSPEQCLADNVDARTDVFALGTITHELITGQRLFKRESAYSTYHAILECNVPTPSQVNPQLDPALDSIVLKALSKEREDRYPSAEAYGEALASVLHRHGKSVSAGAVANFFDQYYSKEISEHGMRMRALIAGRAASMNQQWDEDDSQVKATPPDTVGPGTLTAGTDRDNEEEGATRIEMNPLTSKRQGAPSG
ncbi:MAG: serine/threonine-protein kinase, partial [Myxococcota bacterium]